MNVSSMSRCTVFTALLLLAGMAPASAQVDPAEGPPPPLSAFRIDGVLVDEGPRIDGILDDAVWESASLIDAFTQQEPNEGAPATERTEVRVLYDGSSLFLGIRAFDSSPTGPIATEMRRDANRILDEDNFQVIFDTFRDSRSAYMFVVTPLGAQLDQQVFDEGGRDRRASASSVNRDWDGVWAASARRTPEGWTAEIEIPMVTMRFPAAEPQSWGINFKRNIRTRNEEVFWAPIPRAFDLTRVSLAGSLNGLHSLNRGMDLRIKPYATGGGQWQRTPTLSNNAHTEEVGLDVKYGIIPGLNLDVTYNTDFAQAEVDNEQVNLTRFALFYPEKREFFLENAAQFAVGTTNSTGRIADLFFTRRIGITASRATVPIFGGARLTGKLGANNIAIMDIQTEKLEATDGALIEPGQNFLVARYSRDVFERSQIGALVVNKEANTGGGFNRTYAADMLLSLTPSLTVEGFLAGTSSPGVSSDQLGGHLRAGWLSSRYRIYGEYTDLGDNFNPEVGFVPRVGIRRSKIHLEMNPRPGRWGIRMMEPMWNYTDIRDQSGRLVSNQFHHMVGVRFDNGAYFNVMYNRYFELLDNPYRVTSAIQVAPGEYNFWDLNLSFRSNPARRVSFNASYGPQTYWDGDRTDWGGGVDVRVTDQLATSGRFSRSKVDLPGGDFTADVASVQFDYGFSPRLSLRTLTQYNSFTDQLSTSGRLQYEYRPGSDIFVVYDEIRRDPEVLSSPFAAESRDHQLIVKVTYLLSM
jgi:hypothetical protein